MNCLRFAVLALLGVLLAPRMAAHIPDEDYYFLAIRENGSVEGRFDIQASDLGSIVDQDLAEADRPTLLEAAKTGRTKVYEYLRTNFTLLADTTPLVPDFGDITILDEDHLETEFVQFHFSASLSAVPRSLTVRHNLFYENSADRRGLLR